MNERFRELMEASWLRPLTREEELEIQTHLAMHPSDQAHWEEDQALTTTLARLPAPAVSSNFTARVMQAIDAEERRESRQTANLPWLTRWFPRLASVSAAIVLVLSGVNLYQYQVRKKASEAVAAVSPLASALSAPVLEDFETIQNLRTAPLENDEELVAVLMR